MGTEGQSHLCILSQSLNLEISSQKHQQQGSSAPTVRMQAVFDEYFLASQPFAPSETPTFSPHVFESAVFDETLGAIKCDDATLGCDSGELLNGHINPKRYNCTNPDTGLLYEVSDAMLY